jgi:NAD(P)-dependent dehydrogenase (short-subunit alcohol dehydrogenase family)
MYAEFISGVKSGNAAYNAAKAAVKSVTESLAHELRERPESNVTAHLFMYVSSPHNITI